MTDIEKRAHDVAVAFTSYLAAKENKIEKPTDFADDYQDAYVRILKWFESQNNS